MSRPAPIYQDHGTTYQADACQPVAQAVADGSIAYAALVRGQYPGSPLSENVLQGIRNVGYWDIDTPQPWGLDWHRNEGIELTYLEHGSLAFSLDDQPYPIKAGDITFARPWQLHRVGDPNVSPSRLHWLIMDVGVRQPHQDWQWPPWLVMTEPDLQELTTKLRQAVGGVWHASPDLCQCFQRIASSVETDRDGSNASRLAAYFNELFVLLLDLLREGQVTFDKSLASAQCTVELFWADLRQHDDSLADIWTVRDMAERCGMGVTQFTQHCKALTNMTPMECLNRARIDTAAQKLISRPGLTITDVAFDCGFGSSQYFAKVFREVLGVSPTQYRKEQG